MKSFARYVILAPLSLALAAPALAQQIPAGQTCGGLLCDMGVFGHKVAPNADGSAPSQTQMAAAVAQEEANDPHRLPCNDFLCRAFGGKPAATPQPAPVAAAEPAAEPVKAKKVRKAKRSAKAASKVAKAEPAVNAK